MFNTNKITSAPKSSICCDKAQFLIFFPFKYLVSIFVIPKKKKIIDAKEYRSCLVKWCEIVFASASLWVFVFLAAAAKKENHFSLRANDNASCALSNTHK